jgi:hypothetical protein
MIQQAEKLLGNLRRSTKPKIFRDGFSASGCFVNRFAELHPEAVRALAPSGTNGRKALKSSMLSDTNTLIG